MNYPLYFVGLANDPQPEDKLHPLEEQDAIAKARSMADAHGFYTPIAIWDENDLPEWIFINDEQFRRV